MSKTVRRYSEVQDNLKYIEEHVEVINDKQEKLQNHLIQLREDEVNPKKISYASKVKRRSISKATCI